MTSSKSPARILPARPSLDSLRKQAKKLVREVASENPDAVARARAHLSEWTPPLKLRDAQLVLAREYGFVGWPDLREEVAKRTGAALEWAASEAERAIHDNDVERLEALLAEHPGLLSWRNEEGHPLLQATTPYAMDVTDPKREAEFCRPDCAALLIDAGALVTPSVWDALIRPGAAGMMGLFADRKVLPRTLAVQAALGDLEGVRACLGEAEGGDRDAVSFAFMSACRFKREAVATTLLERCITLDPDLGVEIDRWGDRAAFVADMIAHCPSMYRSMQPWVAFVMRQLLDAMHRDDLPAFSGWLAGQAWLLDDSRLELQAELLAGAAGSNREAFIRDLLDRDPAILRSSSPPPSKALIWALDYGNAHLIPLLTRVWPLPDDLPHAAGVGDLDRVKRWFDDKGEPALGDLSRHHRNVRPGAPTVQQVLDVALAWAVLSKHFEVAEFLLAHGADVNTDWSTHEPAGILHECAMHGRYDCAQFLIEHGVDFALRDHRWNATAAGWARYGAGDEAMATFLIEAEERRKSG
jgi:ankyrin repeat protein